MVIKNKPVVVCEKNSQCNQNQEFFVNNENSKTMDKRNGYKLKESDIVGITIGNQQCIRLNEVTKDKYGWKYVITVKCMYCNNEYTTTWASFRSSSKKSIKGCIKCMGQRMINSRTDETGLTRQERLALAQYKSRAKHKNYAFELTDTEFKNLFNAQCVYCGKQHAFGIDRIDSSKGYTNQNCAPCCTMCNRMKNCYTIEEFKSHIINIYNTFCNEN